MFHISIWIENVKFSDVNFFFLRRKIFFIDSKKKFFFFFFFTYEKFLEFYYTKKKKILKTYKFCKCNQLIKLWVICCFLGIRFCLKRNISVICTFVTKSDCWASIHLFKVNNAATRTLCKIYLNFPIKTCGVFIVNFEHISHLFLVFPLLTLNKYMPN